MARLSPPSLSQRLLALAALWIAVALVVAGMVLTDLFRTHAEAELGRRIEHHLDELAATLIVGADGTVTVAGSLTEPRFHRPLSGLYWQVTAGDMVLRSRSLWDQTLALPVDQPADGTVHQHTLAGFRGKPLVAWERSLRLAGVPKPVRIAVVADASDVAAATGDFSRVLAVSLSLLALGLLAAALAQVRLGLAPLERLRAALGDLRAGRAVRLADRFPAEVQPLVDDLNGLLEANAAMVERARGRAADLAHALKTPLAVIANAGAAHPEGSLIVAEADRMRRQIDRHLARARSAGAGRSPRTAVIAVLDPLVRTVAHLQAPRTLSIALSGDPALTVRLDPQDLQEMVGNLIDNAATWCRSTVRVAVIGEDEDVHIIVEDDGPGIPEVDRAAVLARGGRRDETVPGQGLGLTITAELVHDYGGTLTLDRSTLGGLMAMITLPPARP